jgi:hypothetical protein
MGLVDYSDSDSGSEAEPPRDSKHRLTAPSSKKPFQKLVDSSKPGKIQISLAAPAGSGAPPEEPPAKRAKTSTGGGRFSNFSSFLPPPKTKTVVGSLQGASAPSNGGSTKSAPRPGVHLKTSSEAAFSRDSTVFGSDGDDDNSSVTLLNAPRIPDGHKPAEEVKLIGKPLMFKPLSVARKPTKKVSVAGSHPRTMLQPPAIQSVATAAKESAPTTKKFSLFSLGAEDAAPTEYDVQAYEYTENTASPPEEDENLGNSVTGPYDASATYHTSETAPRQQVSQVDLSSIADSMNLSESARRELFGRDGRSKDATVLRFDTEREYTHNEELRASGETIQHNPVRTIMPGKHSLRQLVNSVQSQREALEENFAKNRANQREAGARYGWR